MFNIRLTVKFETIFCIFSAKYNYPILSLFSDLPCSWKASVEYLLSQMLTPEPRILIGGIEPSLCRVASHLAEKSGKLLLAWTCLEVTHQAEL